MPEPKFIPCMQDQPMLPPPDIGDLVPEGSMARVVDMIVRSIDRSTLTSLYLGGGAPAHDPQMMLKVILLAYASGVYSSRAIARATRENVGFLWICGMRPLDHMTINRFRTERVRHVFEEVFSEVIQLLADMGLVTLDTYFLDGTKMEANDNRFTFVWAKSTKRCKEQLGARVHARQAAIDEMDDEEGALAPEGPAEVGSEAIAEAARGINEGIGGKRVGKRPRDDEGRALRKAKRMLEGEWGERMERHEEQEEALAGRGSHSKADRDATFMRMKVERLRQAGHFLAISTGRSQAMVVDMMHDMGFENMVSDGGYGVTIDGELLGITPLPRNKMVALVRECEQKGFPWGIQADNSVTRLAPDERFEEFTHDVYMNTRVVSGLDPEDYPELYKAYVACYAPDEQKLETLREQPWCRFHKEHLFVEPADKAFGIRKIMDHLEADYADAIVFGDALNDVSMFVDGWYKVAMGNACDEVKALADMVTEDVISDGIWNACERLGLFDPVDGKEG